MHDRNGVELKLGDRVEIECEVAALHGRVTNIGIECEITALHPTEDYCDISLQTVYGLGPDGKVTNIGINTGVVEKIATASEEAQPEPAVE